MAGVVQQALRDLLADRVLPVQADGIGLLDLNNALAPAAGNAKNVLWELSQAKSHAPSHGLSVSRQFVKQGPPIFLRHIVLGTKRARLCGLITP
ncbi:hypothetical protein I6F36_36440 [Bradyrhizobium sp. BRP19]|uniref:hypothetical protein n=1 Tax=Bradyrhizobium sp. BRP19 TaxID=2793823 RepID=UPI0029FA458D|nr:hypothetical protein [Bradyrhizobium sp. BRP19]